MSRLVDVIAIFAVAVVVLLPKASLDAKPALEGEPIEIDRVAALEDALYTDSDGPQAAARAAELADQYLRLDHPDWALSTLAAYREAGEPRVHLVRATAHAERLEAAACVAEAQRGRAACARAGAACPPHFLVRLEVIAGPMRALVEQHIDPTKDPVRARRAVSEILHATKPGTLRLPSAAPKAGVAPAPAP